MKDYMVTVNYRSTYSYLVTAKNKAEAIKNARSISSPMDNRILEADGCGAGTKNFSWTSAIAKVLK